MQSNCDRPFLGQSWRGSGKTGALIPPLKQQRCIVVPAIDKETATGCAENHRFSCAFPLGT